MTSNKKPGSVTVVLYPETGKAVRTFARVMGMTTPEAIAFIVKKSALVRRALRLDRNQENEGYPVGRILVSEQAAPADPAAFPAEGINLRNPLGENVPKRIMVIAERLREGESTHPLERQALKEWMLGDDDAVDLLPPEETPEETFWKGNQWKTAPAPATPSTSPTSTPNGDPSPVTPSESSAKPAATLLGEAKSVVLNEATKTVTVNHDPIPVPPAPPPQALLRRDALAPDAPEWVRQVVGLFGDGIDVPPDVMATFRAWQRGEDVNPEGALLISEDDEEGT